MFFNIGHRYQFMGNRSKDTKLHFEWPKGPSLRFLTGSLSLVCWTILILHVAIVLNVLRHLATYQVFDWFKLFLGLTLSPLFTALQLVSPLVRHQLSWKTALRILIKLGTNVQHDKEKKRTRPFVRKNSRSLIIHENVFFALLRKLLKNF